MQIENIKYSDIAPNPRQPRNVTEPVGEMETVGQIHPIMVLPMSCVPKAEQSDRAYMVIDGHRRIAAIEAAGLKNIQAYVKEIDFEEAMLQALIANKEQQTYGPVEEARAILDSLANRFKDELLKSYNKEGDEWSIEWGRKLVVRAAKNIHDNGSRGDQILFAHHVMREFIRWCGRAGYTPGSIQANIARYAEIPLDLEMEISKKPGDDGITKKHAIELKQIEDKGLRKAATETVKREGKTVHETRALQKAIRSNVITPEEKKKLASGDMKPREIRRKDVEIWEEDEVTKYWEDCAAKAEALIGIMGRNDYGEASSLTQARLRSALSMLRKKIIIILGNDDESDVIDAEVIE